jgi:hypothetical protein
MLHVPRIPLKSRAKMDSWRALRLCVTICFDIRPERRLDRNSTERERSHAKSPALPTGPALKPAIVVAGHKKPGAPDSPSAIQDTKRYLLDCDRLQQTTKSDEELFNQMTGLYPHWAANQSWLMFGFPSG